MMKGLFSAAMEYLYFEYMYSTKYTPILSIIWYCYKKYEYFNKFGRSPWRGGSRQGVVLVLAWLKGMYDRRVLV